MWICVRAETAGDDDEPRQRSRRRKSSRTDGDGAEDLRGGERRVEEEPNAGARALAAEEGGDVSVILHDQSWAKLVAGSSGFESSSCCARGERTHDAT